MSPHAAAVLDDPLLTARQVAERYGYHPHTIYNMRFRGQGPKAITLPGGRIRFRASAVLSWERGLTDDEPVEVTA